MRTTSTLLLVLGFTTFATAAAMSMASKIPSIQSHRFLGMNTYAQPVATVISADQQQLSRANAWSQYRAQVKACTVEPVKYQDACLQQARRERKQNSGMAKKSYLPKSKHSDTKLAYVD